MLFHRVIRIGGSIGITLPKRFIEAAGIKVGDRIAVEFNGYHKTIFIKPQTFTYKTFLTPDYFKWIKNNWFRKI